MKAPRTCTFFRSSSWISELPFTNLGKQKMSKVKNISATVGKNTTLYLICCKRQPLVKDCFEHRHTSLPKTWCVWKMIMLITFQNTERINFRLKPFQQNHFQDNICFKTFPREKILIFGLVIHAPNLNFSAIVFMNRFSSEMFFLRYSREIIN